MSRNILLFVLMEIYILKVLLLLQAPFLLDWWEAAPKFLGCPWCASFLKVPLYLMVTWIPRKTLANHSWLKFAFSASHQDFIWKYSQLKTTTLHLLNLELLLLVEGEMVKLQICLPVFDLPTMTHRNLRQGYYCQSNRTFHMVNNKERRWW